MPLSLYNKNVPKVTEVSLSAIHEKWRNSDESMAACFD
ncbi:hypothetical protein GT23_2139 [Parageobacillus thermoglucosidasius]|nr:hypothetical protein GT23_2139 [Parageobacillus thermoglucosidasius]